MRTHLKAIILRTFLLFVGCQIVFALIWLRGALLQPMALQTLGGGALYQLLIPLFEACPLLYRIICIVWLMAAADFFFQSLWETTIPMRCFRVLGLISFPAFLLQLTAVTPYVGATGLLCIQTGMAIRKKRETIENRPCMLGIAISFLVLCLWLTEGFLFGLIPTVYCFILLNRRNQDRWKGFCLLGILFVLGFGVAYAGEQLPKGSEDVKPVEEMMLARMARLRIATLAGRYPREVVSFLSEETLGKVGAYPEKMEEYIVEPLYEHYGIQMAKAYMKTIALCNFDGHEWIIRREVWKDFCSYLGAPLVNVFRLYGYLENSRISMLFQGMLDTNPKGVALLSYWSAICFVLLFCVSVLGAGFCFVVGWKRRKIFHNCSFICMLALEVLCTAAWYTMQSSGTMDERKVLFLICIWIGWGFMAVNPLLLHKESD